MKYDLGRGHSKAVRSAFLAQIPNEWVIFGPEELANMDYTEYLGNPELIEVTRQVIRRQTGLNPKYIVLTNGATGGVIATLRAYGRMGYNSVLTRKPPYFPLYPSMIANSGFKHETDGQYGMGRIGLIDAPTNPFGSYESFNVPILYLIADAVYGNKVYTKNFVAPAQCDVIIGSYSKLTGLNGVRVGWIGTSNFLLYEYLKIIVTAEYAGLDRPSMAMLVQLLSQFDDDKWEAFEHQGRLNLDYNRGEWAKLEKFFEAEVSPNGMFFYSKMDKKCKQLMEKSGIVWTPGSACGHTDDFGRFNIGQDMEMIRKVVKEVLKNDRRKK